MGNPSAAAFVIAARREAIRDFGGTPLLGLGLGDRTSGGSVT